MAHGLAGGRLGPPPLCAVWRLQWGKIVERCAATPTRVLAIKVWLVFIWFTFISDYAPGPVPNPLDLAVIQQASQPASKPAAAGHHIRMTSDDKGCSAFGEHRTC